MKLKLLAEYLQTGDKSLQTEHWQHVVQVLENLELRDQGMTLGTLERYVTYNTSTVGTKFYIECCANNYVLRFYISRYN